MKFVCLNLWGGRLSEKFAPFFTVHQDVDGFCFQEMYHQTDGKDTVWKGADLNSLNVVKAVLPDHVPLFLEFV